MAFASSFDLAHEILLERKDGFSRAPVSHPQNQIRINRRKWEEKDQVCVKMSLTHPVLLMLFRYSFNVETLGRYGLHLLGYGGENEHKNLKAKN